MSGSPYDDDEIDLAELFAALKACAASIFMITVIITVLAGLYAYKIAKPTYEAKVVFALEGKSGPSLGNLGGLAALAGINLPSGGGGSSHLADRLESRDFILSIAKQAGFYRDPSFNPEIAPAGKRQQLLKVFGLAAPPHKWTSVEIDDAIVENFRKSVTLGETKDKAQELTVVHPVASRAAEIANTVVKSLLAETLQDQIDRNQKTTDYLKSELQKAQEQLDRTSSAIQAFVIAHNAQSVQELAQQSAQLVQLRQTRSDAAHALQGLKALARAVSPQERRSVLENHPELTSPDMLMMGVSPLTQSVVMQPESSRLSALIETLSSHLASIDASIATTTKNAKLSAQDAVDLLKLQRDAKVDEGTYKALVEQYKSHSISAGFQEALGKIYQYASPPLKPSAPKHSLILALGLVLGLFLGSGLALVRGMRRGTIFTVGALRGEAGNAELVTLSRRLSHLLRKRQPTSLDMFKGYEHELAPVAALCIEQRTPFLVVTSGNENEQSSTALASGVAGYFANAALKTAVITLSLDSGDDRREPIRPNVDGMSLFGLERSLAVGDLCDRLQSLTSSYERIIIVPPHSGSSLRMILNALKPLGPASVLLVEKGQTRRSELRSLAGALPMSAMVNL